MRRRARHAQVRRSNATTTGAARSSPACGVAQSVQQCHQDRAAEVRAVTRPIEARVDGQRARQALLGRLSPPLLRVRLHVVACRWDAGSVPGNQA
jgi:hypothetical protein